MSLVGQSLRILLPLLEASLVARMSLDWRGVASLEAIQREALLLQGNQIKITDIVQLRNAAKSATDFRQLVNLQEQVTYA